MAQVKFNRGQRSSIEALTGDGIFNQVSVGRGSTQNSWDSIYLGNLMVGTSMLGLMKPQLMQTPTYTYGEQTTVQWAEAVIGTTFASGVVTTDVVGNSAITTCRKLVDYATAGADGYTANDGEILTAKAVTALVATVADNTHYNNFTKSGWTWTAAEQGTTQYDDLTFTIPVETTNITKHGEAGSEDYYDDHLPTSKAVATFVEDYFSGLVGGMRYCGSVSSTTLPTGSGTMAPYKSGDVFIASAAFTIGTDPNTVSVEQGDMVVIKSGDNVTILTTSNCDVFERNIDGAITGSLTNGQFVIATGTNTVGSVNLIYDRVTQNSNALNTITVTPYTNQTAGSATTITIDDIYHAKFVNTAQDNSTNSFKDVMIDGTYSEDSNHTTYQAPKHTSNVQINPAQGEIKLMYTAPNASTQTEINVAQSITSITNVLEWNDLA